MATDWIECKNNAETTLDGAINDIVTQLSVTDGSQLPTDLPFRITIDDEIIEVQSIDGIDPNLYDVVDRGVEGTTPASHSNGADVYLNIVAGIIQQLQTSVTALEGGIADNLDDTAGGTDGETTKAPTSNAFYDANQLRGFKNLIINGCARVNQRVTAYTLVKDAYCWDSSDLYGADRFEGMATGTLVSAGTFGQTTSPNCGSTGHAFKFSGVTLTGTGIIYIRYRMEAEDAALIANKTMSFNCKVYQDTGGAINYTVYINKADSADDFSAVTAISNSGAVSIPDSTETDLPYLAIAMGACGNGVEIEIKVECGAITTKNFEFTDIQFELGSVATEFEKRQFSSELKLCEGHYEKSHDYSIAPVPALGITNPGCSCIFGTPISNYLGTSVSMKTRKRGTPSVTVYSDGVGGTAGQVWMEDIGGANGANRNASVDRIGESAFYVFAAGAATNGIFMCSWVAVYEL